VFLKNTYFWVYFKPYGNQDVNAKLIFFLSKLLTFDVKYGVIMYESVTAVGNELSAALSTGYMENSG